MAGACEQAGCAHRPFTVPAHDHRRFVRYLGGPLRNVAELDVHRAGQMPVEVFSSLADVQDAAVVKLCGPGQWDACCVVARGRPRRHCPGQFAEDVVVSNIGGLPCNFGRILIRIAHDDQRSVGRREPAQPRGEHRPQRDGDCPTNMGGGESVHWACIDEDRAVGQPGSHLIHAQRRQRGVTLQQRRADPVDFTEPAEVRGIAAQRAEKLCHEGCFVGGLQQRVGGQLVRDGARAFGARRRRAERSGTVGGPHLHVAGQGGQPVQGGVLGAGEFVGAVLRNQVGARGRADDQRPAGKDSNFAVTVEQ